MTISYGICLLISFAVFIYMAQKNYHNVDIQHWTIVILIPVILLSYWLMSRSGSVQTAEVLYVFVYLESTVLITVVLFAILHTLGITVAPWLKILAYGMAGLQLALVGLCVNTRLYYKNLRIHDTGSGYTAITTGGPLIILHYIYVAVLLAWMIVILFLSLRRRGAYAKGNLLAFYLIPLGAFAYYFLDVFHVVEISALPFLYAAADIMVVLRYDYAHFHDISFLITQQYENHATRGYVAIRKNGRFLSCNEKSREYLPFLKEQRVNQPLLQTDISGKTICELIEEFENDGTATAEYHLDGRIYACEISYFSLQESNKQQGYLIELYDTTEQRRAYEIITSYNDTLTREVQEKTENIRDMQRKIVLGMADMIENRDDNTGGHVKRTSDVIHFLVDEIMRQGKIPMEAQFANDIVRAAPTHDLGKITIDSNILNKPARLTDEEYEIMKTHSVKSGEMVRILLDGVEEERFVDVAFNVARYHHERWDGKGYPEGLVGGMIPLEARIMAVADVYDALVSKRVYKEPMSFEKSAQIMCECMGTQFDPNLKEVFLGCREQMEAYYRENR